MPDREDKKDPEKSKARVTETKWKDLEARGIRRPTSEAENARRIKEAHGY